MFEVVCKSHIFRDKLWKMPIKVYLVLCSGPTETQNQNLRPLLNSFWGHKSNGSLRIGKQASIEKHIFWGKHYYLNFAWNFSNLISETLFWKLSIPLNLCWQVGFNFKLELLFWLTGKKLTFWTILPLGLEMWN